MKSSLLPLALVMIGSVPFAGSAVAQQAAANPTCFIPFSSGVVLSDTNAVDRCVEQLKAAGTVTGAVVHPLDSKVGSSSRTRLSAAARRSAAISQGRADAVAARLAVAFPSVVINTSVNASSDQPSMPLDLPAQRGDGVLVTGYVTRTVPNAAASQPQAPQVPTYRIIPVPDAFAIDNFQYTDPFLRNPDLPSTADVVNQTGV